MEEIFAQVNSRFLRDIVRQISLHIRVDEVSVELILKELWKYKQIYVGTVDNFTDSVIVYNKDQTKIQD